MKHIRIMMFACLAMIAFAGNSLLCRIALKHTSIDPASFTTIRLVSGAVILCFITSIYKPTSHIGGTWKSAFILFVYMASFSFAFTNISASTGSLILFGSVQTTMIVYAIWKQQPFTLVQVVGLFIAYCGLASMFLPGLSNPSVIGSISMLVSGIAWGIYSIIGKSTNAPIVTTRNNFIRSIPFVLIISIANVNNNSLDIMGVYLAIICGALTSGVGYIIWYYVLNELKVTTAAVIQLCVPVIATLGGILFLNESVTLTFLLSTTLIIGGTSLVIFNYKR